MHEHVNVMCNHQAAGLGWRARDNRLLALRERAREVGRHTLGRAVREGVPLWRDGV